MICKDRVWVSPASLLLLLLLLRDYPRMSHSHSNSNSHSNSLSSTVHIQRGWRTVSYVPLTPSNIGVSYHLQFHKYVPSSSSSSPTAEDASTLGSASSKGGHAYIQASLHADELPGLLVCNHLIRLLDKAAEEGKISKEIIIAPYANPIGLNQALLGSHIGRFSLATGVNFNRDFIDISDAVINKIQKGVEKQNSLSTSIPISRPLTSSPSPSRTITLDKKDPAHNVRVLRQAILDAVDEHAASASGQNKPEVVLKRELFKMACTADLALDLHCDSEAVVHVYTHDRLWPDLEDLCTELRSELVILSPNYGGTCFDETTSCPWAAFSDSFPEYPIPMACASATVELRGESDVSDHLALQDARALFRLLVGDRVREGALLGEIVRVDDFDAPRVPLVSKSTGLVYAMMRHKLAIPGEVCIKIASQEPLPWRSGTDNLLTSR